MTIKFHRLKYQLEESFTISRMTRHAVDALIIEISDGSISGYGEATDNPYYNSEIEALISDFEKIKPLESVFNQYAPLEFYETHLETLRIHPFLKCAIDEAFWDWYGKKHQRFIWEWLPWSWESKSIPVSTYTIGLDTAEKMKEKIQNQPWPLYKIKINGDHPIPLIRELRNTTTSPFYLDANASLSIDQYRELLQVAKTLNIVLIEQPFAVGEEAQLLNFHPPIPIAGDESFCDMEDLNRCKDYYDVCNFKLMKSGGISPVFKQLLAAQELGYAIMMGCMTESSVGIAALAQFLPALDHVDMDGALLLQEELSDHISFKEGRCQALQLHYGNGIQIDLKQLEKLKYEN